eukprot:304904_1
MSTTLPFESEKPSQTLLDTEHRKSNEKNIKITTYFALFLVINDYLLIPIIAAILLTLSVKIMGTDVCTCFEVLNREFGVCECNNDGFDGSSIATDSNWNNATLIFGFIIVFFKVLNISIIVICTIYNFYCHSLDNTTLRKSIIYGLSVFGLKLKKQMAAIIMLYQLVILTFSLILIFSYRTPDCNCTHSIFIFEWTRTKRLMQTTNALMILYFFSNVFMIFNKKLLMYCVNKLPFIGNEMNLIKALIPA